MQILAKCVADTQMSEKLEKGIDKTFWISNYIWEHFWSQISLQFLGHMLWP